MALREDLRYRQVPWLHDGDCVVVHHVVVKVDARCVVSSHVSEHVVVLWSVLETDAAVDVTRLVDWQRHQL